MKRPTLWHHADFLRFWASQTVSQFGTQITFLALPLIAITLLEASAFEIGILNSVGWLPHLLISLVAGVWVDKLRRRSVLILADLLRGAILLWIPIAFLLDILSLWQLYLVVFAVGICGVFFDIAFGAYLPFLVKREQLVEGNTKLEASSTAARIGGPPLAAGLITLLGAPLAIAVDALSALFSSLLVTSIRKREPPPEPDKTASRQPTLLRDIKQGMRYVLTHPLLRPGALFGIVANFAMGMIEAVFLVYAVRALGLEVGAIGIIFSIGSIGLIAAVAVAGRVSSSLGVGPAMLLGCVLYSLGILLMPLAPAAPVPILIASQAILLFGVTIFQINNVSLRQTITPAHILGRVNGTISFLVLGVLPIGSLVGGALADLMSLEAALWVAAILTFLAVLPIALSPVAKLYTMPQVEEGSQ